MGHAGTGGPHVEVEEEESKLECAGRGGQSLPEVCPHLRVEARLLAIRRRRKNSAVELPWWKQGLTGLLRRAGAIASAGALHLPGSGAHGGRPHGVLALSCRPGPKTRRSRWGITLGGGRSRRTLWADHGALRAGTGLGGEGRAAGAAHGRAAGAGLIRFLGSALVRGRPRSGRSPRRNREPFTNRAWWKWRST